MTALPLPLVPLPASVRALDAPAIIIDDDTTASGDTDAVTTLRTLVQTRTGLRLDAQQNATGSRIVVEIDGRGPAESYRLAAEGDGIRISAADAAGLFYGVQTLGQLIHGAPDGWRVPAVRIDDAPRFEYRGVMLDTARHFHTVQTIEGYIDRASALKFNVLHLHLSDDQGWRLELRRRPELTARASATAVGGDPGGFYSREDYRRIVRHAARRHMTVVPEFDMPGHTHAVSLAYPELNEQPVLSDDIREAAREDGGALPENGTAYDGMAVGFSSLRIHDAATDDFVVDVFTELAELTPGPYLHFGGDEALGTSSDDFAAFVARASAIIGALGRTPIAWHEAGAADGLATGTVGQYWGYVEPVDGMDEKARAFVRRGGRIILSPADAIYLDMKPHPDSPLGLTWARGVTSVERAYSWEPSDVVTGLADDDILGVEAPMWAETVRTPDDIDALAYPRIAAAAEAAWSPATGTRDDRTWSSFRQRVGGLGALWTTHGIRFAASEEIPWRT